MGLSGFGFCLVEEAVDFFGAFVFPLVFPKLCGLAI